MALPAASPGPQLPQLRLSEAYVQQVARDACFWAWPLVDLFARRSPAPGSDVGAAAQSCEEPGLVQGCAVLALDASPVVIQVPDMGDRFWAIPVLDARTDSIARIGSMHGSAPGFYLVVGPGWVGEIPPGIRRVFASRTGTVAVMPRIEAVAGAEHLIDQFDVYPVAEFDGCLQRGHVRWQAPPVPPLSSTHGAFRQWLPGALASADALPGEAARYRELAAVLRATRADARLAQAFDAGVAQTERELLAPLVDVHRFGHALPHHWATLANTANFGTDYFARTLAARGDPLQPLHGEAASFYLGCDADGDPLDARQCYTLRFDAGMAPPALAFWSLAARAGGSTAALPQHAIVSRDLPGDLPGAEPLELYLQAAAPAPALARRWLRLPVHEGHRVTLCLRCYWPGPEVLEGRWTPPAVIKAAGLSGQPRESE